MIALAVGLGVLGIFALRRARRRCHGGGYGWYGPWADYAGGYGHYEEDEGEPNAEHGHGHGEHGGHRWHGGPPWRRPHGRRGWRGGGRRGRWMLHAALARIDATPAQER